MNAQINSGILLMRNTLQNRKNAINGERLIIEYSNPIIEIIDVSEMPKIRNTISTMFNLNPGLNVDFIILSLLSAIEVGQPVARLPLTDPGVRNYRTRLLKIARFTHGSKLLLLYPLFPAVRFASVTTDFDAFNQAEIASRGCNLHLA